MPSHDPTTETSGVGSAQVRPGGELAARDAAALMLGLAAMIEQQVDTDGDVHPDLRQSLVDRLRRHGAELATSFDQGDLLDGDGPPVEGTAFAAQLAAVLRDASPPGTRSGAPDRPRASDLATEPTDRTTAMLDRSGIESFPASDPPSP